MYKRYIQEARIERALSTWKVEVITIIPHLPLGPNNDTKPRFSFFRSWTSTAPRGSRTPSPYSEDKWFTINRVVQGKN